ncbi:MAG TPA: histidine phosphatase family protein [Roseiflexaceae bacterium]|nr:histidine phosphatase family protein [Roseiflexaceae bacterium]HMP38794.1 histidine phosphatase family protein [Roseiflexaceae bacterium]
MTTELYLIRHGEAHSNVEPIIGGMRGCRGLTERGFSQARALEQRLAEGEIAIDVLYASTLLRARQTAEHVGRALDLPIHWDDELHEIRPGLADGMTVNEARERFGGFSSFFSELFTPLAPEGESWASFQFRVSLAFEQIINRHPGKKIAIVCHGGVIEVSFLYMLQLGPQARTRNSFHVRNTAITHWRHVTERDGRQEWHLAAHNDHAHLRGLE